MSRSKSIGLLLTILISFAISSLGQSEPPFDFYQRGPYRESVPRPQSILRYDVGRQHTTYGQMEQVIFAIAKAAPERVKIFEIGLTNENRMQYLVAISSPDNMARLEEIRTANLSLVDPRKTPASQAAAIAARNPSIAWMAYTIHGNESSSFEAFMQVIYQLAASDEPATLDILKNNVVLVLTGENPDGHERFATWYNSVAVGSPDRNAIEHREPWSIWGRVNHYRFNLNRDTLAFTQRESRNMQAEYMRWMPQLAVDHHGQPAQYFFPPVALPINPNLVQPQYNKWLDIYGRANAAAFDQRNWDYYVRDIFDAFYPGYWDMYPSLQGASGMTYETDGGGFKGLNWTRDDGTIVTFRSSIAKHYVASMTTLETNGKFKTERIKDFYDFRVAAMAGHASSKLKRIIIDPTSDRVKAAELIEVLRLSNVEVKVATAAFTSSAARTYLEKDAKPASRRFPAGSYIIDLDQPQRAYIKAVMEQDTQQDKAFIDDNMARFRRNQMRGRGQPKEDYGFYDITAWSLPLSLGIDAFWTDENSGIASSAATTEYVENQKRSDPPGRASIAYVIPYETDSTSAFVIRLLQNGFRVAVATRPLNAGGRNWRAGTFVIRVSRNPDQIHDAVARWSREMGVNVTAVNSGYSDEGDTSVGGEYVISLRPPRIAIAADEGVTQESYGSIWWTFDKYGIRFTPMTLANIRSGAARGYNILILPDGNTTRLTSGLGPGGINAVKEVAQTGGSVITMSGSAIIATLKDVGWSTSRLVGSDDVPDKPAANTKETPTPAATPEFDPDNHNESFMRAMPSIISPSADGTKVPEPLAGTMFRARVDRTTYLNYGVNQNEIAVLLTGGSFFTYSKEGTNALTFDERPTRPLTVSGFAWEGNTERLLAGTSYLIDESVGSGRVIMFAEDPFFRGMTRATTRQFFNSIAFNGIF